MKRVKENIIFMIIGVVLSITLSFSLAETLIESKNVSYVDNSKIGATNVQAAIDGTCTKFSSELQNFLLKVYPVGSIYISTTLKTPTEVQNSFGGTWVSYGVGKTLLSSTTSEQTGGSNTVTLTTDNLPAHTHDISHTHTTKETTTSTMSLTALESGLHRHQFDTGGVAIIVASTTTRIDPSNSFVLNSSSNYWKGMNKEQSGIAAAGNHTHNVTGTVTIPSLSTNSISTSTSGSTGGGKSFSVQNEYITVYMYKRTK